MDLHSTTFVYEIAPPFLNNRELPTIMLAKEIARLTAENEALPEHKKVSEQEIWHKAKEKVHNECDMIWFGVQAVSMPDSDKLDREVVSLYNDYTRDKATEMEGGKRLQQIKEKVKSINNLTLDGNKITTFDEFYHHAPKELVQWLCGAVHSIITLSLSERKNFLPE